MTERKAIIVTGLSGAGRTTSLKCLEDQGFEAVDNLPISLLPALLGGAETAAPLIAVGMDMRTRDFDAGKIADQIQAYLGRDDLKLETLFLDCDDETLAKRFTETRRRHPLAADRPVSDGIQLERAAMADVRAFADHVIDTSKLSIPEFRTILFQTLGLEQSGQMAVNVQSFAYRNGLPREADLVFDVRFLKNPHYDLDLRPLDGTDKEIGDYITGDPDFTAFYDSLIVLLGTLLPRYASEGKSYLTIAFGCTGGRHRSVYLTETVSAWVRGQNFPVSVTHRDKDTWNR